MTRSWKTGCTAETGRSEARMAAHDCAAAESKASLYNGISKDNLRESGLRRKISKNATAFKGSNSKQPSAGNGRASDHSSHQYRPLKHDRLIPNQREKCCRHFASAYHSASLNRLLDYERAPHP